MYEFWFSPDFNDKIIAFQAKHDDYAIKKVKTALEKLKLNPKKESKSLQGNYKGKRSHRSGKLRLILAVCEECRARGYDSINACVDCSDIPDNGVMFFDALYRSEAY